MIVKNVEKQENNTAVFQVESDAAEFEAAVNGVYLKNKASIYIPGFRKGKAPRAVVEGMYGKDVFYQDALDELAPQFAERQRDIVSRMGFQYRSPWPVIR